MSRTYKDRNKKRLRCRKNAFVKKMLCMWNDDFPKRKDRTLSQKVRSKLKRKDLKETLYKLIKFHKGGIV